MRWLEYLKYLLPFSKHSSCSYLSSYLSSRSWPGVLKNLPNMAEQNIAKAEQFNWRNWWICLLVSLGQIAFGYVTITVWSSVNQPIKQTDEDMPMQIPICHHRNDARRT